MYRYTHVFEAVLAELREQVQRADEREPGAPEHHLVHVLHVDDAEHEDELIEHVVPELVLDALRLGHAQLPEHQPLHHAARHRQRAVRHVDHRLQRTDIIRHYHYI